MLHKSRIKKLMFTAQFNKLEVIKIYNRLDILFMPIKSSFLCAISTCKKRLNCMLLSDLIVLFENVLLNSLFKKKIFCFQESDKKRILGWRFLAVRISKGFLQFSEGT